MKIWSGVLKACDLFFYMAVKKKKTRGREFSEGWRETARQGAGGSSCVWRLGADQSTDCHDSYESELRAGAQFC